MHVLRVHLGLREIGLEAPRIQIQKFLIVQFKIDTYIWIFFDVLWTIPSENNSRNGVDGINEPVRKEL